MNIVSDDKVDSVSSADNVGSDCRAGVGHSLANLGHVLLLEGDFVFLILKHLVHSGFGGVVELLRSFSLSVIFKDG